MDPWKGEHLDFSFNIRFMILISYYLINHFLNNIYYRIWTLKLLNEKMRDRMVDINGTFIKVFLYHTQLNMDNISNFSYRKLIIKILYVLFLIYFILQHKTKPHQKKYMIAYKHLFQLFTTSQLHTGNFETSKQ